MCVCMCMCMCVCARERETERDRETDKDRQRQRDREIEKEGSFRNGMGLGSQKNLPPMTPLIQQDHTYQLGLKDTQSEDSPTF